MHFSGIFIVILIGVALGEDCCGCWDRCFPQQLDADTQLFYNMIDKLRGVKLAYNIKGMMLSLVFPNYSTFDYPGSRVFFPRTTRVTRVPG